ncbi:hypothetical protein EVAR_61534_1 [Eumeta japonica]|uniref:Uncharacterized protein n=1 Tax=Eumeta variegata TaxID=151549 RepID=A0A4C1YX07_EUMVA|nr:hypothetical protein EVAR_61534_1 [Eumeta japonica]
MYKRAIRAIYGPGLRFSLRKQLVSIRANFVESYHQVNTKRRCPNAETLSRHESSDCGAKSGITHAQQRRYNKCHLEASC